VTGLPDPSDKAAYVRDMFDRIAPRYDRVNRILTLNTDQRWRRGLVRRLAVSPGDRVLDLACGTGDFAQHCQAAGAEVVGLDFSRGMLLAAKRRTGGAWVQGDALRLPFAEASFDVVVSGFALRNFTAIEPVLHEAARVLRKGGRIGILEVDRPRRAPVRAAHGLYFDRVVPRLGSVLGRDSAYRYLPRSAVYLPAEEALVAMLVAAGFRRIQKKSPLFGAAQALTAERG